MRYFGLACTLAIASLLAIAAPKADKDWSGMLSTGDGPQFRCQLGQRIGTERDSVRLVVAMSVPYDNLVFLRADSGFIASFELVTSVFRDGTGLYDERITALDVPVAAFAETNSRTRNALHVDEFIVPAGDYRVRAALTSKKQAGRKSKWEGSISLAPTDSLLRISDVYWIAEDSRLADLGVPRLVEGFSAGDYEARARVQLYSAAAGPLRLTWVLLNEAADTLTVQTETVQPTGSLQLFEFAVIIDSLRAQNYMLRLEVEGNGRRETRARPFSVRIPGIPQSITDLDLAIRQLKYIATSEENSRLRRALPGERDRLFRDFWKRRDPSAGTDENELMDEYYRRVEYSNTHFSTNRDGWEVDRGRIFVLYGEPTDIERHPFEPGSRPYEIWFYSNLGRRFVFVDYTGFGDYQLASPEWGY